MIWKTSIGQDSHRFEEGTEKQLVLGGFIIENEPALKGNSDADVILHAITNAISGITCVNILGFKADELCAQNITDSRVYLNEALKHLKPYQIEHLSISLECQRPKIKPYIEAIRNSVAQCLAISADKIGLTATSGEGLTDFGRGLGIQCFCILTVYRSTMGS